MKNAGKMNVLVIQQKMIGDVLASTVICEAIRQKHPNAEIHYLVHAATAPVVEGNPYVDKLILFKPTETKGLSRLMAFGKSLRKEHYYAVIDPYGKLESVIIGYFTQAPIRIGFKKWHSNLSYTQSVTPQKNVEGSAIRHRLQLAEAFTGQSSEIIFPKIYLSQQEISKSQELLQPHRTSGEKIIMVSLLGSDQSKSLPDDIMASVLDFLAETPNIKILLNFMPSQNEQAKQIFEQCLDSTRNKIVFDLYMKGLRGFLGVLSQCDALVGNEGGAVNMAKALNIPTFTVFSPWIRKESWNMLSDDKLHVAIHLKDFEHGLYEGKHPKELKKDAGNLYKKLTLNRFKSQLEKFLKDNIIF